MRCRGIRGATTVGSNTKEAIVQATKELLGKIVAANGIEVEEVVCAVFTTPLDLNAEFPAVAAREMGWTQVALLCGHEMDVPGSLPQCLRILVLYNTEKAASELVHVYIKGTEKLRAVNPPSEVEKS